VRFCGVENKANSPAIGGKWEIRNLKFETEELERTKPIISVRIVALGVLREGMWL